MTYKGGRNDAIDGVSGSMGSVSRPESFAPLAEMIDNAESCLFMPVCQFGSLVAAMAICHPAGCRCLIREIEDRGSADMAHRVRNYSGEMFGLDIPESVYCACEA